MRCNSCGEVGTHFHNCKEGIILQLKDKIKILEDKVKELENLALPRKDIYEN